MSQIIDRRLNGRGKSTENRQKFIRRAKEIVKDQIDDLIINKKLKDLGKSGGTISVPRAKRLGEPSYRHGMGGNRDYVLPGNKKFTPGDRIWKPREEQNGGGDGNEASDQGHLTDVELTERELLDIIFDDLELPNMVKKELSKIKSDVKKHSGFNKDGSPNKLSIIRSVKQSFIRTIPIEDDIEEQLANARESLRVAKDDQDKLYWSAEIERLLKEREEIPFLDPLDLRYKQTQIVPQPSTHATMIMLMDNSGSMTDEHRVKAKRFFALLYRFLSMHYDGIDTIFISHTTEAHEMTEEEFFTTGDSGGTIVSSGLEMVADKVYDLKNKSNVYVCQVSDGDNWSNDDDRCFELLVEEIMDNVQYFAYIQLDDYHNDQDGSATIRTYLGVDKGLWRAYEHVAKLFKTFQMKRVFETSDIFPVFRELFAKKSLGA